MPVNASFSAVCSYASRLWRLCGTAVSFACFGLGGLFLALFILPVARLSSSSHGINRARRCIQLAFRAFVGMMRLLGVIEVRWQGLEKLRQQRGVMVIGNHPSLIDYVLIASQLPNCNCIVKRQLWSNPFLGGVVRAAGYIANDEGVTMVEACRRTLSAGDNLLIFPEGTRSREGEAMTLQRGAGNVAMRVQPQIVLCHITVVPRMLAKTDPWYYVPKTKSTFNVRIGETLDVSALVDPQAPLTVGARQLTRQFAEHLQRGIAPGVTDK
ncbi:1-acyl-sn-glycerol-3-phosphate acyltransferase [Sinobacterium caligoides]|uniref:1-acyl-sn-glycerol-3-phosphate acyltransferase n=1 Tax=Sinobacterium caligoides TaxID=933926 RepID=A0A3N2DP50_9GAMM|nr:lysophospholipid acyltransferase family protein [Sinobacterium caligoides]ROS01591.1 1-acyl-sn-glycerol-3-phosphate acyltransferase [Sinobacterium caligoides]